MDQQDLYMEETDPRNPHRYRYRGRWRTMKIERETIPVKGKPPVSVELAFTVHGPVIHEDREHHRAWALRWVGSEPGTAGYLASLSLDRARSWPEFLAALERWKVPTENLVYADVDGNIGWKVAGLAPVRRGWDGLLPVPGAAGRFEWQGFLPASELPGVYNPAAHFVATANHNILPPGYPHELGYDWAPPDRVRRIAEVLGTPGRKFTTADLERLQHDELSHTACDAVRLLAAARRVDEALRPYQEMLARWDCLVSQDSAPAALYEIWATKLPAAVFRPAMPEEVWKLAQNGVGLWPAVAALLTPTSRWFGEDPAAGRDAALVSALRDAVAEAKQKLGDDPATWRWGTLHKAPFQHMLSTDEARRSVFDLPSPERGGDGTTVLATSGRDFLQNHGASFREVLDVADWDRSTATSVPGQSGQPGSPHYGDLLPLWAEGRYFPLLYSREKIEEVAKERLVLMPAG
jgi:penicillin amidase